MKRSIIFIVVLSIIIFSTQQTVSASIDDIVKKFPKGSLYIAGLIGINSYAATDEPFDAMPFPLGTGFEAYIADNIAIGSMFMFDKWSDYLGVYGGKWTLQIFKPSLYITYNFKEVKGLSFFAGANLGYNIFSISNELGNDYEGDLKSGPFFAPYIGTHLYFRENLSGFFSRLFVTLKMNWSVVDDFTSIYGTELSPFFDTTLEANFR